MRINKTKSVLLGLVVGLEDFNNTMTCGIAFRIPKSREFFNNSKDREITANFIIKKIGLK